MVRTWLVMLAVVALVAAAGCGVKDSGKNAEDGGDANAPVEASHWGAERVVYAADFEGYWQHEKTRPGDERWEEPAADREYFKFTFHGDKLTKLETFGQDGEPLQRLKTGLRVAWRYAAHGGMLEEIGYDEDDEVDELNTRRYDGSGRVIEETYGYGSGDVVSKTACTYSGESTHPDTQTVYDGDGNRLSRSTYSYSADGRERVVELVMYDSKGKPRGEPQKSTEYWNAEAAHWGPMIPAE